MGERRNRDKGAYQSSTVKTSKALSYILRHGAEKEGLAMRADGYVKLTELLAHSKFKGLGFDDIQQVVDTNDKQRFKLIEEDGEWIIKANQGHSLEVEVELDEIKDASEIPVVVHGTSRQSGRLSVPKTGLKTMGRTHIHFATGLPGESGVISGMRKACDVLIYIDTEAAIKDGIQFFRSPNNVILCPTTIEPKYFKSVHDKYGQPIDL
ncbi:phosphotransferase KptA/Tpt1 [Chytridium lagenaria]|nr:phosphotransferase KptA/Tpt1 [Chytridium lagenaria]